MGLRSVRPLRIEARFLWAGIAGEVRINDFSAEPALWSSAKLVGTVELSPWLVRGWNEVELWLRRVPDVPEEERMGALELFASGPYREAPSGDDCFLAYDLTPHLVLPAEPALSCALRHRFWVPDVVGERTFERGRPGGGDLPEVRAAVADLHAALATRDLRAWHRAHRAVLGDTAAALEQPAEDAEAAWLEGWAATFAAEGFEVEPLRQDDLVFERVQGGRATVVRRRDGAPAMLVRTATTVRGESPAFGFLDGGWRRVR
jgi:hypothetical protein